MDVWTVVVIIAGCITALASIVLLFNLFIFLEIRKSFKDSRGLFDKKHEDEFKDSLKSMLRNKRR